MHLGSFRMCAACRARLLYASARTHTRGKAWTVFRPGVYITPVTCTRPGVQCCGRSSCLDVRIDFLCVPHSLVPWHKMLLLCQGTNRTFSVRCSCYPSQRSQVRRAHPAHDVSTREGARLRGSSSVPLQTAVANSWLNGPTTTTGTDTGKTAPVVVFDDTTMEYTWLIVARVV